jgi:hypothetical protein
MDPINQPNIQKDTNNIIPYKDQCCQFAITMAPWCYGIAGSV